MGPVISTRTTPRAAAAGLVLFVYLAGLDAVAAAPGLRFVNEAHGLLAALGWGAARFAMVGAVAMLLVSENGAVARGSFLWTTSAYVIDLALRGVTGDGLTPATVRLALEEGSYGGAAISVLGTTACVWALLGLGLMHALWILVRVLPVRSRRPAVPLATVAALSALALALPGPLFVPLFVRPFLAVADVAIHRVPASARRPLPAAPTAPPRAKHIVVLVDESVRGDLLSLARPETRTTPWLEAHRAELVDLGVASSTTNCSATAHAALLGGATPRDLPDPAGELRRRPTLFGAAAGAGLRTVLVDAQATGPGATLALDGSDRAGLSAVRIVRDERPALVAAERDRALADIVIAETSGAPSFVYAIKRGAHYPYAEATPPSARHRTAADAASLGFRPEAAADAARYLDALEHAVDGFLADLLPRLDGKDVLVFYTSDHGESLLEDGRTSTHCTEGAAPPEQGRVPFLLWAGTRGVLPELPPGPASAFRLHPAVLRALGYPAADAPLFTRGADELRFFSGDILGRSTTAWNPIR